eukprot:scaffold795_cov375-Prasinococcus_capsulatus_cf.AAC.19
MALLQAASGLRSFSLHSQRSARRTQPVACPLLAPARGNTRLQSPRHTATVTPTPVSSRRLQCVCKSRRLEWGGARLHQSHKAQHSPQEMPESVEEMVHDVSARKLQPEAHSLCRVMGCVWLGWSCGADVLVFCRRPSPSAPWATSARRSAWIFPCRSAKTGCSGTPSRFPSPSSSPLSCGRSWRRSTGRSVAEHARRATRA